MPDINPNDPFVKEVFTFLNKLRESGKINMFGAPKVLSDAYGFDSDTARKFFSEWTKTFNKD